MSQTEELSRREEQFLENVLENLRQRIRKIAQELEEGQKDIESMHEYYWENYTEMDIRRLLTFSNYKHKKIVSIRKLLI